MIGDLCKDEFGKHWGPELEKLEYKSLVRLYKTQYNWFLMRKKKYI